MNVFNMEKLIIRFQQSLDTKQQTTEFIEEFCNLNIEDKDAFGFAKKYVSEHSKYVIREFSEDIFKDMKTMEKVYEFIKNLFF